jgi:hypothetical protein
MNTMTRTPSSMFQDSIPNTPGEDRYAGIRALWLKVIIRAVFDWVQYRDSDRLPQKKLADSAKSWLFDPNELFNGFANLCESLDVDPEKVRKWACGLSREQVAKIEHLDREPNSSSIKVFSVVFGEAGEETLLLEETNEDENEVF